MSSRAIRGPFRFDAYAYVTTGNHTVVNASVVIVNKGTGAATTITLPPSLPSLPSCVREIIVIDGKGDAGSNNITIAGAGSDTINGSATLVMSANYGVSRLFDIGGGKWVTG